MDRWNSRQILCVEKASVPLSAQQQQAAVNKRGGAASCCIERFVKESAVFSNGFYRLNGQRVG